MEKIPLITRTPEDKTYFQFFSSNWTISDVAKKTTQLVCAVLNEISVLTAVSAFNVSEDTEYRKPIMIVSLVTATISSTILLCSFGFKKPPLMKIEKLVSKEYIEKQKAEEDIHHLCGIELDGKEFKCSYSELKKILDNLAFLSFDVCLLNTIPSYFIEKSYKNNDHSFLQTPLQCWAGKGDVNAVKLLLKHGAVNLCVSEEHYSLKSALYSACLNGHPLVAKHLLSVGAGSCLTQGKEAPLTRTFIPQLIEELCHLKKTGITQRHVEAFKLVLAYLKAHAPNHLNFQLKIPISDKQNALAYVQSKIQKDNLLNERAGSQQLVYLLAQYITKDDVFSPQELPGNGITLSGIRENK